MLRQSGRPPDPVKLLELRANTRLFGRTLQRELEGLKSHQGDYATQITDVYNKVYLLRARVLADRFAELGLSDFDLLSQPLHAGLAASQLGALVELLQRILTELGQINL